MRTGIEVEVSATDRIRLDAIVADRNAPQKHVCRAQIVLLTTDGCGAAEIMRDAGVSKTVVWRWQERAQVPKLFAALSETARLLGSGNYAAELLARARGALERAGFSVDYFALVDGPSLEPLRVARPLARLIAAARLGSVRLIDNVAV